MSWKLPNGKTISTPKDITVGDTQYSSGVFRRWSKEELNAIGIFPFREEKFDQKWYRSTGSTDAEVEGEVVRTHTTTKRMTNAEAKEQQVDGVKAGYMSILPMARLNEEFYGAVGDNEAKKLWSDYISDLGDAAKSLKNAVNAAGSYAAIKDLKFEWPNNPDYIEPEEDNDGSI
jgi:hypothetical protein